eukprot:3282280-Pleurochrysis_carterae.AAC.1
MTHPEGSNFKIFHSGLDSSAAALPSIVAPSVGPTLEGMRKLEALLAPYASRLSAADMVDAQPPARVAYIPAAAERMRAAAATTQQRDT